MAREFNVFEAKFLMALDLLMEVEVAPDDSWWRAVYDLAGEHMVLTDEGWQPGTEKESLIAEYGADCILDELHPPPEFGHTSEEALEQLWRSCHTRSEQPPEFEKVS